MPENPDSYVVSGPCQCPNCRRVEEILRNAETLPEPGMFRSWGQLSLALIGGAMFLGAIFMLWAIFSR